MIWVSIGSGLSFQCPLDSGLSFQHSLPQRAIVQLSSSFEANVRYVQDYHRSVSNAVLNPLVRKKLMIRAAFMRSFDAEDCSNFTRKNDRYSCPIHYTKFYPDLPFGRSTYAGA